MADNHPGYECDECPKVFKTAVGLGSHQKAHKPPMVCPRCGAEVIRNMDLHNRKEHSGETMTPVERNLRTEIARLRAVLDRKDQENRALRAKLALAIRSGARV